MLGSTDRIGAETAMLDIATSFESNEEVRDRPCPHLHAPSPSSRAHWR
jgi:hypothetical protein